MNIILALSLLLAAGFGVARLAKFIHLPAVTGYIVAGIALGPAGFGVISAELLGSHLQIFTNIALMLVAFAIGERFDLQQLSGSAKALAKISCAESFATLILVGSGVGAVAWATGVGGPGSGPNMWVAVALVCASIAVATAPAATIAVIREIGASGPVSRTVLSGVVVNNVLSIIFFGLSVAAADVLLGTATAGGLLYSITPLVKSITALTLGIAIGLATDFLVHKLIHRDDVLIVAITAVLLCGGVANYLGLSSLLTGMAAGFAVVNRDRRDVRAFRALNDFEPPIYALFFTLAGAQLHWGELLAAGAVGATFVVMRGLGKYFGAWLGAWSAGMPPRQASSLGLGLLPQAGLAIGLAYLVGQDESLQAIQSLVISVVVTSVVVNELIGPPLVRIMALRTGEAKKAVRPELLAQIPAAPLEIDIVPWRWPKLQLPREPSGFVVASVNTPTTCAGLTRIATLLSHHYGAVPLALHVITGRTSDDFWQGGPDEETMELFRLAQQEAANLGYHVHTEVQFNEQIATGILKTIETHQAKAVVLGHPRACQDLAFSRIVDAVAEAASCQVVVVRFVGTLHTERILVPISTPQDFAAVHPLVCALGMVADHSITVLRLMPPETSEDELRDSQQELAQWPLCQGVPGQMTYQAAATESRVHEILQAAEDHDIIVMAATTPKGLRKVFFGSLAEDVAQRIPRPMLLVRGAQSDSVG